MIRRLKSFVPPAWIKPYHLFLSWLAAAWYGHPSNELIVIGVTGTKGKTTTCYLIAKALEADGSPTGCTTTALFKIGEDEWINATKMTMLGRFRLQSLLRRMVTAGCRYAVIETSSQGVEQFRHRGINYDVVVFTNLTPEHIEAHGGFENYREAKIEFFRHTASCPRKVFNGVTIQKSAVLNAHDPSSEKFALPGFDRTVRYGDAESSGLEPLQSSFVFGGVAYVVNLPGQVNVENALAAITVASLFGLVQDRVAERLASVRVIPGRYERIEEGQAWSVIVDYAHEPSSLEHLYETVGSIPHQRIIHVVGSAGGGRDKSRRAVIGKLVGEHADLVLVTNEDPYDENPATIIEQVAAAAREAGKVDGETLFTIQDRRAAISQAMRLAQPGDLVLLTGKGSEQAIMGARGTKTPWDEREVAREAIHELAEKI